MLRQSYLPIFDLINLNLYGTDIQADTKDKINCRL